MPGADQLGAVRSIILISTTTIPGKNTMTTAAIRKTSIIRPSHAPLRSPMLEALAIGVAAIRLAVATTAVIIEPSAIDSRVSA